MKNDAAAVQWPDPAKTGAQRSIFAPDLTVEGDVSTPGPVEIQGKVLGQVTSPDILIAPSGTLDGTAIAHDLSVLGTATGTISARRVSLAAGAVVLGDITHEGISIEAGAQFEGSMKRKR